GIVTSDDYDFKGNLLGSQRQLAQGYKTTLNWSAAVPLGADTFTSRTRYDALNRPTELTTPHSPAMQPSVIRPTYNEANLLERVDVDLRGAAVAMPFVTDIDYDAKGQRTLDIIGDSVYWLYANLCNPTSQIARVSGRDRTDARRVCACAAGLCCGLCRPLSTRQDLGRQGAPTPERRRRQRRLSTDGRQTALHPRLPDDQSATNYARLAI